MNNRILVTYASATGSTTEVAAAIGKTISDYGFTVDVKPMIDNPSLEDYTGVLIGSAVQHGNWLPEAVEFVKNNQQALSQHPVAIFTVHIQNLGKDQKSEQKRLAYLDDIRPFVHPFDSTFFAGRFNRRGAKLLLPRIVAFFIPPMDFRQWDEIRAWADAMATQFQRQVA